MIKDVIPLAAGAGAGGAGAPAVPAPAPAPAPAAPAPAPAPAEDEADQVLTAEQTLALGDSYYVDESFAEALDAYAVAIAMLCSSTEDNKQPSTFKTLLFRSLSHKAAVLVQLGRYQEAVTDCNAALGNQNSRDETALLLLRPGESQACLHVLGIALFNLKRYAVAHAAFSQAAQLASFNGRDTTKHDQYAQQCDDEQPDVANEEAAVAVTSAAVSAAVTSAAAISAVHEMKKPLEPPREENDDNEDDEKLLVEEIQQKAPPLPKTTTTPTQIKPPTMPKYQYYQNDNFMKIEILESNLQAPHVNVIFTPKKLTVIVTKQGIDFTVICGRLFDKVNVEKCKIVHKEDKVLIKLRKTEPHDWHELFSKASHDDDDDDDKNTAGIKKAPSDNKNAPPSGPPRPYASHRDWNAIGRDLETAEKSEKPAGDAAMNALFQQIYGKADEDTKRAMIKSYQTSGGTVLSTNWDEVKAKDYEEDLQAPKGMEWKTWEGDKVKNQNKKDGDKDKK